MKTIEQIGYVQSDFVQKFGIPRQSLRVNNLCTVVFEGKYANPVAFRGIENFSHLWLVFGFSEAKPSGNMLTVRPPRLGGNVKIGVFASRSPFRPNGLGLSVVKLEKVVCQDNKVSLVVSGADLLNNTPVYDVKPYVPHVDRVEDARGGFSSQYADYKLKVTVTPNVAEVVPQRQLEVVVACIADDPRPSYQDDDQRVYSFAYADFDVKFRVKDGVAEVFDAEKR